MAKSSPRGRASKPEIDFSTLTAVEESEPLTISRAKEANPFTDMIKDSVEREQAFAFHQLPNERAAKQAVSLLSRGAANLDYGMSTRIEKEAAKDNPRRKLWVVKWQAKKNRTRRPRKVDENGENGNGELAENETDE